MKTVPFFVLLLLVLGGFIILLWPHPTPQTAPESPLVCLVGGTMTPVFNDLAAAYQKATGRQVEISSADSGELLASIEMNPRADLYVAHDPFMDIAMQRGLGVNAWRLGDLHPVIIVQKGNPKNIHALRDFFRPDVRVYLTDYQHSTLGVILPILFSRAGLDFAELNRIKPIPTHRSGSWVANQLILQAADAALVWQVVSRLRAKDLDEIPLGADVLPRPGVDVITSATRRQYFVAPVKVGIISLACSSRTREIMDFVSFIRSSAGRKIFENNNFDLSKYYGRAEYINGVRQSYPPDEPTVAEGAKP